MDRDSADAIADAIRSAGTDIENGIDRMGYFDLTGEQWEMLPRVIGNAAEIINHGMGYLAAIEGNADDGRPGLVDGLYAISQSLSEVANAIKGRG